MRMNAMPCCNGRPHRDTSIPDTSEHCMQQIMMPNFGYEVMSFSPSCHPRKRSKSESIAIWLASLDDSWREWQCSIPNPGHQSLLYIFVWCIWYRVMSTRSALSFLGASFSYILSRWHHRWQSRWQLWAKLQLWYCEDGTCFKFNIYSNLYV